MGVIIDSGHSAVQSLCDKHLEMASNAEELRKMQTVKLALVHVKKGAELTRENKCFEAIQCFNKAINVYPECADAFVGRGAACAGNRNFPAALQDMEKALELQPEHRNANKYRLEVLFTYGKELERSSELSEAREKFNKVLTLCPGHQGALDGLERLNRVKKSEVIEVSDEEEEEEENGRRRMSTNGHDGRPKRRRDESMSEEQVQRNRQKLAEMEAFIAKLKSGGKK